MTGANADVGLSPVQRRRQVAAVLNPAGATTYPHLDRAVELACHYGWHVEPMVSGDSAHAHPKTRTIWTPPIVSDETLALFCHEGGHCEDPDDEAHRNSPFCVGQPRRVSITAEVVAWRFALQVLGYRWNASMAAHLEQCMWSYRRAWAEPHPYRIYVTHSHIVDPAERTAIDDLVSASREQARHVVRIRPVETTRGR